MEKSFKSVFFLSTLSVKKLISTAFENALVKPDPKTEIRYYVDPVSLMISKIITQLDEPKQKQIMAFYYTIYFEVIPNFFRLCKFVWYQFYGLGTYIVITRLGKKFCPYLIRWHWTFLILLTLIERPITMFLHRAYLYTNFNLKVQLKMTEKMYKMFASVAKADKSDKFAENMAKLWEKALSTGQFKYSVCSNFIKISVVLHLMLIFLGFLHALFGQYFYVPFLVQNTELQVGPRPKNSVYSQGKTPWQDNENSSNANRIGRKLLKLIIKLLKKLRNKLLPPFY